MKNLICYWWDELLPKAIYVGLSPEQFWFEEPYLLVSYLKAYELKTKDKAEEWKAKTNFKAWLNGAYISNAVASVLSKNSKYPSKPFDLYEEKNSLKASENAIKERSKAISEMLKSKVPRK